MEEKIIYLLSPDKDYLIKGLEKAFRLACIFCGSRVKTALADALILAKAHLENNEELE